MVLGPTYPTYDGPLSETFGANLISGPVAQVVRPMASPAAVHAGHERPESGATARQRSSESGAHERPWARRRGLVGRNVGHYVIRELMGRGGMASVYRAEHRVLGREVAIKILHKHYASQDTMVHRFVNEARSMASLDHAGILAIHDIGRTRNGDFYTVMELLKGETLGERLEQSNQLSEARTLKIARQVACALAAAHDTGVIHRDIKPDNIFLVPDLEVPGGERVKVLDFGIAKMTGDDRSDVTAVGIVVGTPAYMAPEQCTPNAEVDDRADIYSLGALMYRMVTGQKPFVSTDEYELLRSHLYMTPPSPIESGASISLALDLAIMKCLAKDPGARFQSMRELAEHLAELEAVVEISGPVPASHLGLPLPAPPSTLPMAIPVPAITMALGQYDDGGSLRPAQQRELTGVEIDLTDLDYRDDADDTELGDDTAGSRARRILWSALVAIVLISAIMALVDQYNLLG